MALANAVNLAGKRVAEEAWMRLYDSFPVSCVSKATGEFGFEQAGFTTASTGAVVTQAEAAAQAAEGTYQPTSNLTTGTLVTYRSSVEVTNELLQDSSVQKVIAARLSGQIIEKVASVIVNDICTALNTSSRFYDQAYWVKGNGDGENTHSGANCFALLNNEYRKKATWIFSKDGALNFIGNEGNTTLSPNWMPRSAASQPAPPNNFQPPPNGGILEESKNLNLEMRNRMPLSVNSGENNYSLNLYLNCPWNTAPDATLFGLTNTVTKYWCVLADLSSYLLFHQPLQVMIDSESKIANNISVVHASYRAIGKFLEPTAGWGLKTVTVI